MKRAEVVDSKNVSRQPTPDGYAPAKEEKLDQAQFEDMTSPQVERIVEKIEKKERMWDEEENDKVPVQLQQLKKLATRDSSDKWGKPGKKLERASTMKSRKDKWEVSEYFDQFASLESQSPQKSPEVRSPLPMGTMEGLTVSENVHNKGNSLSVRQVGLTQSVQQPSRTKTAGIGVHFTPKNAPITEEGTDGFESGENMAPMRMKDSDPHEKKD